MPLRVKNAPILAFRKGNKKKSKLALSSFLTAATIVQLNRRDLKLIQRNMRRNRS